MSRILAKSLDLAENFFAFVGGILLLVSVLSVIFQVISRYFFDESFVFVNELNEYILLYVPFLGAAWLLRQDGHITIDLLEQLLPSGPLKALDLLITGLGVCISAILVWYGTIVTLEAYKQNIESTTVVQFPQVYVLVIIPLGSLLLLLEFLRKGCLIVVDAEQHNQRDGPQAE